MAGGMNRRGQQGPSLYERVQGAAPRSCAEAARTVPPPGPAPSIRHCWVTGGDGRHPALLLEWRRAPSGWQGRVVRPVVDGGRWVVVEEWLPAEALGPA